MVAAEKSRFDNYKVLSLFVKNENQFDVLKTIENSGSDYLFWNEIHLGDVDIMVPPHKMPEFTEMMHDLNLKFNVKVDNVQE